MTSKTQLIGDIGGTNARFALTTDNRIHDEMELTCADFPTFADAVEFFLSKATTAVTRPTEAAIDVAAALTGDQVSMTNCPWQFSISDLRKELQLKRLIVLNDFTALAMAIRHLPDHEVMRVGGLQPEKHKPIAVLGAGTGLGVSGLIPVNDTWIPLEGEGGHTSWSPSNERETAVLNHLWQRYDHVSTERVLSGMGLVNLYLSLCALDGKPASNFEPADISRRGMDATDAICAEALQMFCGILGTAASNLVVTLGAKGGVYIGGGIVPRLGDYFLRSPFRQRFESKGRYEAYLAPIPAYVITAKLPAFTGLIHSFTSPGPRIEATA